MACIPSTLVSQSKAFAGLDDLQLKLVIISLLCTISEGSSEGGGGNSILSGPDSPVGSVSTTGPAIYVQNDGTFWVLPEDGDSGDWIQVTAIAPPPPIMLAPPPPEPDLVTINRLATVESRLMDIDHRSQAMESGIGSLHASVLGVKDMVQETDEAITAKASVVMAAASEETDRRCQSLELQISELRQQLQTAAKAEHFERVMAEVEGLKPKPVILPVKKSVWSKLRDWSTNLFA